VPRNPQFEPTETSGGWMVSIPANMTSEGRRVRRVFPLEAEAKKFGASLRTKFRAGQRGGNISHELAVMAGAAAALLEPHGITLMDAARAFIAQLGEAASPETFRERYLRAMLDGEGHWSAIYAKDMGKLENWTGKAFMEMRCAVIQPRTIMGTLGKHGAKARSTLEHRTRYVNAILNFKPRHRKETKIAILTVAQAARFIRAGETRAERMAAAVLLFAGVRPDAEDGEISRLDWSAFGKEEIYIGGEISKTGTDRHIPLTRRLRRLIKGHPQEGPVVPANWRRVYKRLRKAAGIHREQDITRHTFASNFLAAFGEHAAKQALGHTAGSATLFRHYRAAVTETAGKRFFSHREA